MHGMTSCLALLISDLCSVSSVDLSEHLIYKILRSHAFNMHVSDAWISARLLL